MNPTPPTGKPRRRKGAALVLTLFFLLLISGLIVMFIIAMRLDRNITENYMQSARVREMALGATEEIISDLRKEIAAGSRTATNFLVNGKQIYSPITNLSSQPARIGFTPGTNGDYATDVDATKLPPSLIRVSRSSIVTNTVFPSTSYDQSKLPPQRASAVSTAVPSQNGRSVSGKRWNASYLMGENPPSRFTNNPPEWIYVSRAGSRVSTDGEAASLKPSQNLDATNTIVGRYAYIIYDQGGLLDINTAGYPSTLTNTTNGAAAVRAKSSALFASLTSLPGLTNKTAEINDLVNWRGKGSIAAAGTNGFVGAATNWVRQGFLQVTNGDSPILSRQDLIEYFTKKVGSTAALPYLGTFSRYVAAPSSRPSTPAGVTSGTFYDYNGNADSPTITSGTSTVPNPNRDLANIRFLNPGPVTHYTDDAISQTYSVTAGDPLLQSRFSLARLAWLEKSNPATGSGPTSPYTEAIKSAFGLEWGYPKGASGASSPANGGNKCWNYIGSTGSIGAPPGTIKTLAQVAAESPPREPNFFELLKAAILSGSLGKSPGPAAFQNGGYVPNPIYDFNRDFQWLSGNDNLKYGPVGYYSHTFGPFSAVPVPARIPDMQIIRIGANIIDQYDADSYPTAIYFRYDGVDLNDPVGGSLADPIQGPVTMAYGIENLPYLSGLQEIVVSPDGVNTLGGWRQPFLWNLHQPPAQQLQNRPANYQIRAYGTGLTGFLDAQNRNYQIGISPGVDYYQENNNSETSAIGTLNFTLANPTSASAFCFYEMPYPLLQDGLPGVTATSPYPGNLATSIMAYYSENMPEYNLPNHFAAFSTGVTNPNEFVDTALPLNQRKGPFFVGAGAEIKGYARPDTGNNNTYVLGWTDSSGGFHPYSFFTGAFTYEWRSMGQPATQVGTVKPIGRAWIMADPRTDRFSLGRGQQASLDSTLSVYRENSWNGRWAPVGRPGGQGTALGFTGSGYSWQPYGFAAGDMMVNSTTDSLHNNYYSDPDGVVRPGDAFYGNPATGDGMMTYFTNGAPSGSPTASVGDTGNTSKTKHGRRPLILNRPFQSVGELGYVFRDQPFKSLDFFSDKSADAALLDVFSLTDLATVALNKLRAVGSGRVNPNAAPAPVLAAILRGGAKKELDSGYNLGTESDAIASAIARQIMTNSAFVPVKDYRELAPLLVSAARNADGITSTADKGNKAYLEAPLRAMTESANLRTWNLMIDVVAQSGRISESGTKLSDFVVQSECRLWLHIAIDRYSGEVIARQLEPIYE